MNRKKRALILLGAGIGWGAAGAVTAAAPFIDFAQDHPFLVHRVFALLALGALVLTTAWIVERARKPEIPVSAATAYDLGVEFGRSLGRMEAAAEQWNGPQSAFGDHRTNRGGQLDTPPAGWLRR